MRSKAPTPHKKLSIDKFGGRITAKAKIDSAKFIRVSGHLREVHDTHLVVAVRDKLIALSANEYDFFVD